MLADCRPHFRLSITDDGSPTLWPVLASSLAEEELKGFKELKRREPEKMHSPKGALSETLLVYGKLAEKIMSSGAPLHFVPVGLGLGYVEWVIVALALRHKKQAEIRMLSFEAHPILRNHFLDWIKTENPQCDSGETPCFLTRAFESCLERVAQVYHQEPKVLKATLRNALTEERWRLEGEMEAAFANGLSFSSLGWQRGATGIFYDAYSNQSTPQLWSEEFLALFFERLAGKPCEFASYAATGSLNRALRAAGFVRESVPGYGGKRESTYAHRL